MADLTTTAAVKAYAGVTDGGDDSAIRGIVAAVSALIHGLVGHDYEGDQITAEYHSPPMSGALVLNRPAESIDAVRAPSTLDAAGYRLVGDRLLYRISGGGSIAWGGSVQAIEVDYTTTSKVPADLELAAREIGAYMLKQSGLVTGGGRMGLSGQANADSGSADYFTQALRKLPMTALTLRRYQRLF